MANRTYNFTNNLSHINYGDITFMLTNDSSYEMPTNNDITITNGTLVSYNSSTGDLVVTCTNNTSIAITCPANTYTVSFDANGGSGTMESVQVEANSNYVLPACTFTAPTGKEFDAWQVGSDPTPHDQSYEITVTGNVQLRALGKTPAPAGYEVTVTPYTYNAGAYHTYDADHGTDPTKFLAAVDPGKTVTVTCTSGKLYIDGGGDRADGGHGSGTCTGGVSIATDGSSSCYMLYNVTGDGTISGFGGGCFAAGTKITLADYTTKNVEDITYDDELLVGDFYGGKLITAKPSWIRQEDTATYYHKVTLSDGTIMKLVGPGEKCHRLFNVTKQQMLYANECVGDEVYKQDGTIVTVLSCEIVNETVKYYNLTTETYYDCFADGVLTGSRLNNLYHISDMKYDSDERLISEEEEAGRWQVRKASQLAQTD